MNMDDQTNNLDENLADLRNLSYEEALKELEQTVNSLSPEISAWRLPWLFFVGEWP